MHGQQINHQICLKLYKMSCLAINHYYVKKKIHILYRLNLGIFLCLYRVLIFLSRSLQSENGHSHRALLIHVFTNLIIYILCNNQKYSIKCLSMLAFKCSRLDAHIVALFRRTATAALDFCACNSPRGLFESINILE